MPQADKRPNKSTLFYLWTFGSWKISCQMEKSPLFWSFKPIFIVCTICTLSSFWPRPWRNCNTNKGLGGYRHHREGGDAHNS